MSEEQNMQLKEAVKEALNQYESDAIVQMLVQQGYDPFYAQSIVDEAEEEDVVIPTEEVEDTSYQDELAEQEKIAAQQEEDALEATRQQMLADQQQMADEDADADIAQDMEEEQYFNFAMGGMPRAQFGMDVNPMPNAQYSEGIEQPYLTWPTMEGDLMRDGGVPSKRSFLKKMTKHLMKANMGMEQSSKMPSPYGDVSNPTGSDISGKKKFVSALNKQTQMFQAKQQAEQMYNNMFGQMAMGGDTSLFGPPADQHDPLEHLHQYGESLSHELPLDTSMETMQFGGFRDRRIKRANRALFGVPFMPPGANVDYEFGPLGGLRKASANIDTTMLSELFKMLPGSPNANPFVTFPDVIQQMGYEVLMNKGELVDDVVTAVNNQSLEEVEDKTQREDVNQTENEASSIVASNVIPKSPKQSNTKSNNNNSNNKSNNNKSNVSYSNKNALNQATNKVNSNALPPIGKRQEEKEPDLRKTGSKAEAYYNIGKKVLPFVGHNYLTWFMEEGGFVDAENPELYKFIYGGDDVSIPYINSTDMYRKGGRILPKAEPGISSFDQFRLQKLNPDGTLKNKPSLPGGEELMGNPYRQPQRSAVAPSPSPSPAPNQQQGQQMSPQQMQMLQQYMQMMQQQGMPFAYGAPRGLGRAALRGLTGLSRDFNYFTGDNPGNWNIPEGYTNLRKESFKDRGKWYNPFDTKRVTTYEYTKPGQAGVPGAPGTAGSTPGAPGKDSIYSNTDGLSGKAKRAIRRGERKTARQVARGMEEFPEDFREDVGTTTQTPGVNNDLLRVNQPAPSAPGISNVAGYNSSAFGPGYSGIYSDANGDGIPDYLAAPGSSPVSNFSLDPARAFSGSGLGAMERSDAFDISQTQPQPIQQQNVNTAPAAPAAPAYNSLYPAGMSSSSGIDSIYEPDMYDMGTEDVAPENVYFNTQLTNPGMSNPYERQNPLLMPTPNLDRPAQVPGRPGPQLNTPTLGNPYSRPNPLALGFAEGGFIPDYYTFDGYLPMANYGIVSDNPDFQMFQDPNAIKYKIEEQSGWSWDPTRLGHSIGIGSNIASNILEDLQSVDAQRYGSNKQNYARDIDRELVNRGVSDQEGLQKKAGFKSGRTSNKYGGPTYKNGGTYSLTQDQIDQIRKMGGDVEFI